MSNYTSTLLKLIDSAKVELSNLLPSEWAEKNRVMTSDLSAVEGKFSYKNSPYTREIVDCLSESHPSDTIVVIKGAQIGFSAGVIENGIGWTISENPGNILFLVGHEDLVKDSAKKLDQMIDGSGIRDLIKSNVKRKRNTKSGDTDGMKEYSGGYLKLGITNHKSLRNISMRTGFIDDFEGMKGETKEAGSTVEMIEQRFAAFAKKKKLFFISTPELKEGSNIEGVYLLGDQRKFHIPCPCCGEFIPLEWYIQSEMNEKEMVGITWKTNDLGELISESVGYTCQKCGDFFDDSKKMEWLNEGYYIPTAKPSRPGYYSYHISALYAPPFMYGWEYYVRKFMECNPSGGKRHEEKWKTFKNLVLGETYEPTGESISASELQENIRPYEIGIIPEKLSIADGNGKIVMLTCGCDLNGKEDDARLDYEIIAHSETGATYSVDHGSIGTFIPLDKHPEKRDHWTYRHGARNNVWDEFEKVISAKYERDIGGAMLIFITGVDSGYQTSHAYQFVDNSNFNVISLKGSGNDKFVNPYADLKSFKQSKEKGNLFLVENTYTKDTLSYHMSLKWNPDLKNEQPYGFMNFPTPSDGKYLPKNYFNHFEAEHKIIDKKGAYRWIKKSRQHQNHLFDCRLYGIVARDIFIDKVFREMKIKNAVWKDYVAIYKKKAT